MKATAAAASKEGKCQAGWKLWHNHFPNECSMLGLPVLFVSSYTPSLFLSLTLFLMGNIYRDLLR